MTVENDGKDKNAQAPLSVLDFCWPSLAQQAVDYWIDACQRSVLTLDVLRQRGNMHFEQQARPFPTVLNFDFEVIMDGRKLVRPVNYMLLRILPTKDAPIDKNKRPFIIFDPRAGHGPGIGGMKRDSQIGIAHRMGHPCYFVGFLSDPVSGQTIEDVSQAEAVFVEKVIECHPNAEKPCFIGNCQAGWQIMLMSAIKPDLASVIILAATPLSYWNGLPGKNPMRYSAGLQGGSWLTTLESDLGNGIFDGAEIVQSFETLHPAQALWNKFYNLYAKVDTEAQRFLDFERWWGSPALLNGEEMQFIVDDLFIGNRLTAGKVHLSNGLRVDLRNIKAPIVVFCSLADDIVPPQQALGWILDLYGCDDEIVANGQTIVYALHRKIGHFGIFVSSSVAAKEHDKFINNIDLIETLPPGLYEAIFTEKDETTVNPDLASGKYIARFEKRCLGDIRLLGGNTPADDRCFATVARVSESLQGLYKTFVSPYLCACVSEESAAQRRKMHPGRLRFELLSDKNPLLKQIAPLAETVRKQRRHLASKNLFWNLQELFSKQITTQLEFMRVTRDSFAERLFYKIYNHPYLQASVGLRSTGSKAKHSLAHDVEREKETERLIRKIQQKFETGGLAEAMVRGLVYVSRGTRGIDEREFQMLRRLRKETKILPPTTLVDYKALIRQQHMLVLLDEKRALESIPRLLDSARGSEAEALSIMRRVVEADGMPTDEERRRLEDLQKLFKPANVTSHQRTTDMEPKK